MCAFLVNSAIKHVNNRNNTSNLHELIEISFNPNTLSKYLTYIGVSFPISRPRPPEIISIPENAITKNRVFTALSEMDLTDTVYKAREDEDIISIMSNMNKKEKVIFFEAKKLVKIPYDKNEKI